ncbi:MAG: hypothetical protein HOV80_13880 [Polyangiaceae bacterium]|nr:hypothetical protein [Polyangiaceae bacterium]
MPKLPVFARRALCAVSVFGGGLFLTYGCGTDAVGVDACRQIEEARCDAAPACTGDQFTFGIRTEEQVRNCKALYRDQCLHGIENAGGSDEDEVDEPSDGNVDKCIKAIKATANCKRKQPDVNGDTVTTMADCPDVAVVSGWSDKTPCETLNSVEKLDACKFVAKKADNDDDGDTTATATATTTTGSGGAGGSGGGGG